MGSGVMRKETKIKKISIFHNAYAEAGGLHVRLLLKKENN